MGKQTPLPGNVDGFVEVRPAAPQGGSHAHGRRLNCGPCDPLAPI
jgi:hypothetical protein